MTAEKRSQALLEAVQKARSSYEERQDDVQEAKDAYYQAVRRLHESGMPLREVADALGLSHQRVHQMIAESQDSKKARLARRAKRAAGAAGAVLIAVGVVAGTWAWSSGDDDHKVQPAATDRLAQSPSATNENPDKSVEYTVRFRRGGLRYAAERSVELMWHRKARWGPNWQIIVPPDIDVRFRPGDKN